MTEPKYILRFFVELRGGCLWPGNDASYRKYGLGPYDRREPCPIPISTSTVNKCIKIAEWHDKSLNWTYPPDPGPWRQEECDRFNQAVKELFIEIEKELGKEFILINQQALVKEDPELDMYIINPKQYKKK
jgi:hypothetical protein